MPVQWTCDHRHAAARFRRSPWTWTSRREYPKRRERARAQGDLMAALAGESGHSLVHVQGEWHQMLSGVKL